MRKKRRVPLRRKLCAALRNFIKPFVGQRVQVGHDSEAIAEIEFSGQNLFLLTLCVMIGEKIQLRLGGFTVNKGTLFLLCNFFLLLGVVIGMLLSPAKHGLVMHIGCNNGNSGNYFGGKAEDPKENEQISK
jgi:hypothetical protein